MSSESQGEYPRWRATALLWGVPSYADEIARHLRELGVSPTYGAERGLPQYEQPSEVVLVGLDIFGRARHLAPHAARAWGRMREAARNDGVELLLISAFRDIGYQRAIFDRKLRQGVPIEEILRVNVPPGYSEHHTGRAVDIATRGCPPLTEAFDATDAFRWLTTNADRFGFALTYGKNNPYGIDYEPWHWAMPAQHRATTLSRG
jgi:zinc D-Ala-D-Ala carboxypeptidase